MAIEWTKVEIEESPGVRAETLTTDEVSSAAQWLQVNIMSRDGYEIKAHGTCAKGPQGIWWSLEVWFESESDRALLLSAHL